MANVFAPPPPPQPPQPAGPPASAAQEQLATAVAVNGLRLQAIVERLIGHFQGTLALPSSELNHLFYALARGIDYALSSNDVPEITKRIPALLKKVYQNRNDASLHSSVMVLVISCKNACNNNWFQVIDSTEILKMANELSSSFCTSVSQTADDSSVLDIISTIMPRFYPQLKFGRLIVSLEAKMGYDILMADFFIQRNLPPAEKIKLIVVQKENLDASSCITSPPLVSFLVNGKGVDRRTNVSMETGPQFPTDITKMLKYGTNIIQAVGHFNANYIIAIAYMSNLTSFTAPKLDDYVQPVAADRAPDSDIIEGPSRVSLNCPISFRHIKTPIKGRLCKHHQCFDYDNYLEMNSRKPTWRCPCCNTPSNSIDLRIDQNMVKILKEVGDDIADVLIFADGSWKAVSANDEKSTGHASGNAVGQNGDVIKPDACPSADIIDLIIGDDGDLAMNSSIMESLPEKHTDLGENIYALEDRKPLLNVQDFTMSDFLSDPPVLSTPAHTEVLTLGGENSWLSNITSTSGQNILISSVGGLGSNSFGTLESILPEAILHPVITDAVSLSLETSQSTFAIQPVSQVRQHTDNMQLRPSRDSLFGSEIAGPPIPRNVRRDPIAVQALPVPSQNPGSSRRVQINVLNYPHPPSQSSSTSSAYQAPQVTSADGAGAIDSGVELGQLSRAFNVASSLQHHTTPQDVRSTPNLPLSRVVGLPAPHLMGTRPPPGQTRGASAYRAPPLPEHQNYMQLLNQIAQTSMSQTTSVPQPSRSPNIQVPQVSQTHVDAAMGREIQSPLFSAQHSQAMRSQVGGTATLPQSSRVQSPTLPMADRSTALQFGRSSGPPELPLEQNWRPTGRMRGSLTGNAYSAALDRYLVPPTQQPNQTPPPGVNARGPLS